MNAIPISLNLAERLRLPSLMSEPDPRSAMSADQMARSLAIHHAKIAAIQLNANVPEPIAIQFETAKNLYLYAWHVYRFYMVALTQALTALEFGLRERLPHRLPEPYQSLRQKKPMLFGMLGYAVDEGLVRNEGFRRWHEAAALQARERRRREVLKFMLDHGLEFMESEEIEPLEIMPEDRSWDLVSILREGIPSIRNELAHGGPMLTGQVHGTIELVGEILNQLHTLGPTS